MSRSNPTAHNPNPAVRRFEWKGSATEGGHFAYYDKQTKENVAVPLPFRFMVLDRLATVGGFSKKHKSGIYANEVLDTREQRLVVKVHGGGVIAEGFWADIKEKVAFQGGKFGMNIYVAFKDDGKLAVGVVKMVGCSLGPWFDFEKKHGKAVMEKGVVVKSFKEETSGQNDYRAPVFEIMEVTPESDAEAKGLSAGLDCYFAEYFKRNKVSQAAPPDDAGRQASPEDDGYTQADPPQEEEDVPF